MKGIAERVKERRLEKNLTQRAFSKRVGVGYDAYRRFENSGEITLQKFLLYAIILDTTDEFSKLLSIKSYQNIDELLEKKQQKADKEDRVMNNIDFIEVFMNGNTVGWITLIP